MKKRFLSVVLACSLTACHWQAAAEAAIRKPSRQQLHNSSRSWRKGNAGAGSKAEALEIFLR